MDQHQVTLTIDGRQVTAAAGSTILQAALASGIYIPHLCDQENLRHTANCRLCMVKVAGRDGVVAACSTAAEDGMEVEVFNELAEKVRKLSVDFMFKTHPNECTGCPKYGRCQLQSISQVVGDTGRALRSNPFLLATDDANPIVLHEMARCVLCGRCVRACAELRGVGALGFEKVNGRPRVMVQGETLEKADCRFCGACIEVCPTGAIREQELIAKKMEDKTREEGLVPCKAGCPAHIDIPKYLRYIREENYPAAVAVVREKAPFPHALGYICTHRCETDCRRGYLNDSIAIRDLKRYACAQDHREIWREGGYQKPDTGKTVAVIGAGPAGLTAAYYLAKSGHKVTVFEALEKPGGMMQYGIPEYRLPRDIVAKEISEITDLGVEVRTGRKVEKPAELLEEGYHAVLVSIGAHSGVRLPVDGCEQEGVYLNIDFLRAAAAGNPLPVDDRVIVLGGGNVALDCAGVARRLGAKEVHLVCLEARDAMTCTDEELEWALEEGAQVHNSKTFLEITGDGRRADGLRFAGIKSFHFEADGRSVIELEEDSEEEIKAGTIIFATGQRPRISPDTGLTLGRGNRIVPERGSATNLPGVFAAGDVVTGTDSVIRAIAGGRQAASEIDLYLGGDGLIDEKLAPDQDADPVLGTREGFAATPRQSTDVVEPEVRLCGFATMDLGYDDEHGLCEAGRCLQCDLRLQIAPQKFWSDYDNSREVSQG